MEQLSHNTASKSSLLPLLILIGLMFVPAATAAINWAQDEIYECSITDIEEESPEKEQAEEDLSDEKEKPKTSSFHQPVIFRSPKTKICYTKPITGLGRVQELCSPPPETFAIIS